MYKINSMFPLVGGIIILTSIYLVKSQISGQCKYIYLVISLSIYWFYCVFWYKISKAK